MVVWVTSFKSSTNQAPRKATSGFEGELKILKFELKVVADVGLVGLPNAGKSTFIRQVSARPSLKLPTIHLPHWCQTWAWLILAVIARLSWQIYLVLSRGRRTVQDLVFVF